MTTTRLGVPALVALLLAGLTLDAAAQSGVAASQPLLREAVAARDAGDFDTFTAKLERARTLNPASYFTRYNLARGYAQTDRPDEAFRVLEQLARARIDFGVADDDLLQPLADDPRYPALLARITDATRPQGDASHRYTVPRGDLVAEGIAWDARGERLFFGSMRTGEVFSIDRHGRLSKFAAVAHDGPMAAIGMTVDDARQVLWVIGTDFFLADGFDADAPLESGVFGFRLGDGELLQRSLRDDVSHGYNDVTVAPNGDLYLSGVEIGRLPAGGEAIEAVNTSDPVFGSNGIAVTPDGRHLILSSYPASIAVIRLSDGETWFPTAPADVPLYGIDGMYLHEGDLVAVQNGPKPWRLMRFELNDELTEITAARTLLFAEEHSVPTTGAIVGDVIHYIGQGPAWQDPPQHLPAKLHPYLGETVIMTAPLD